MSPWSSGEESLKEWVDGDYVISVHVFNVKIKEEIETTLDGSWSCRCLRCFTRTTSGETTKQRTSSSTRDQTSLAYIIIFHLKPWIIFWTLWRSCSRWQIYDKNRYSGYVYDAVWLYARVLDSLIRKDKSLVQVNGEKSKIVSNFSLPGFALWWHNGRICSWDEKARLHWSVCQVAATMIWNFKWFLFNSSWQTKQPTTYQSYLCPTHPWSRNMISQGELSQRPFASLRNTNHAGL